MRVFPVHDLLEPIRRMAIEVNYVLPPDVRMALEELHQKEDAPSSASALEDIIKNYGLAEAERIPICQDCGMCLVFLEIGEEVFIEGDLEETVQEAVRQGYVGGYLRKSMVADPLRRVNTKDNTPAMIYTERVKGDRVRVTVAPKGFGSENMSKQAMLKPSDGLEGVKAFVVDSVRAAGPNPCPPVLVGVGIGGNFDKSAYLAKKALLRPVGEANPDPFYAKLERELLDEINQLGIGAQGYGGASTAMAVHILTLPTHIAGLPVAVNLNCHATRHVSEVL